MRVYVDGLELDVQDPKFFMDEKEIKQLHQSLADILEELFEEELNEQF